MHAPVATPGGEESSQRDLPVEEHVGRTPPEEHGGREREHEDETATAHRANLVEEPDLTRDVGGEGHDPCGLIDKVAEKAPGRSSLEDLVVPRLEGGRHPDRSEDKDDRADPGERGYRLIAGGDQAVDIVFGLRIQPHPCHDRLSDVASDDGRSDREKREGRQHGECRERERAVHEVRGRQLAPVPSCRAVLEALLPFLQGV